MILFILTAEGGGVGVKGGIGEGGEGVGLWGGRGVSRRFYFGRVIARLVEILLLRYF